MQTIYPRLRGGGTRDQSSRRKYCRCNTVSSTMHTRKFPGEKKRRERRTFKRKLTIPSTKDIICKSDINTSTNSMGKQRKKSDTGAAVVESFLEEMTMIMMMTMIHASMLFFCLFKNATPKRQQKKEKKKNQKKRQTDRQKQDFSLTNTEFPKLRNKIRIRNTWLVAKQIVTEKNETVEVKPNHNKFSLRQRNQSSLLKTKPHTALSLYRELNNQIPVAESSDEFKTGRKICRFRTTIM